MLLIASGDDVVEQRTGWWQIPFGLLGVVVAVMGVLWWRQWRKEQAFGLL